jgi:hypothetical protein
MSKQKPIIIVAGLDQEQRPHAARFTLVDEQLAAKAASLMGLKIGMAETSKALSLARELTKGRVFATGRALVPYVKQEVFDETQTAILFEEPNPILFEPEADSDPLLPESAGDPIAIGRVVLALEGKGLGWWEAIVLDVDDEHDRVSLKWREWPELRRFTRTRAELGIIGAAQLPESSR